MVVMKEAWHVVGTQGPPGQVSPRGAILLGNNSLHTEGNDPDSGLVKSGGTVHLVSCP